MCFYHKKIISDHNIQSLLANKELEGNEIRDSYFWTSTGSPLPPPADPSPA